MLQFKKCECSTFFLQLVKAGPQIMEMVPLPIYIISAEQTQLEMFKNIYDFIDACYSIDILFQYNRQYKFRNSMVL